MLAICGYFQAVIRAPWTANRELAVYAFLAWNRRFRPWTANPQDWRYMVDFVPPDIGVDTCMRGLI